MFITTPLNCPPPENLVLAEEPRPMDHRELGRYFSRYDGVRYVPLAAVSERYPDPSTAESEDGETATATAADGRRTEAAGAEAGNTGGEGEGEAAGRVSVNFVDWIHVVSLGSRRSND